MLEYIFGVLRCVTGKPVLTLRTNWTIPCQGYDMYNNLDLYVLRVYCDILFPVRIMYSVDWVGQTGSSYFIKYVLTFGGLPLFRVMTCTIIWIYRSQEFIVIFCPD